MEAVLCCLPKGRPPVPVRPNGRAQLNPTLSSESPLLHLTQSLWKDPLDWNSRPTPSPITGSSPVSLSFRLLFIPLQKICAAARIASKNCFDFSIISLSPVNPSLSSPPHTKHFSSASHPNWGSYSQNRGKVADADNSTYISCSPQFRSGLSSSFIPSSLSSSVSSYRHCNPFLSDSSSIPQFYEWFNRTVLRFHLHPSFGLLTPFPSLLHCAAISVSSYDLIRHLA